MDKWVPVISLVLGSVLTIVGGLLNESVKENRVISRERDARGFAERQESRRLQSQAARELQEAFQELYTIVGDYWAKHGNDDVWAATPAERVGYGAQSSRIEVIRSRIADDRVRVLAQQTQELGAATYGSKDRDTARENWKKFENSFYDVVEALGPTARSAPPETS